MLVAYQTVISALGEGDLFAKLFDEMPETMLALLGIAICEVDFIDCSFPTRGV